MSQSPAYANVVKLRNGYQLSVSSYSGFDPTGATSSIGAFTAAYNAAGYGQRIYIPNGSYAGVSGVLTGSKFVIWVADGYPSAGGYWYLPGVVEGGITTNLITEQTSTTSSDLGQQQVRRTSHTGGSGNVANLAQFHSIVQSPATNNENTIAVLMEDASSGTSQNFGILVSYNKTSTTTAAFGLGIQALDMSGAANPAAIFYGQEIFMSATGTDTSNNRIGLDIQVNTQSGATCHVGFGLRVGPSGGVSSHGSFGYGAYLYGNMDNAAIGVATTGPIGIQMLDTSAVGIDLSGGTHSTGAIRLKNGEAIVFDASNTYKLQHQTTGGLYYFSSGTAVFGITEAGGIQMGSTMAFTSGFGGSTSTATAGSATLPSNPVGFVTFNIGTTQYKFPYYAV